MQQTSIIKPCLEQGQTKAIIRTGDYQRFKVETQFGINMFLWNVAIVLDDFKVNRVYGSTVSVSIVLQTTIENNISWSFASQPLCYKLCTLLTSRFA